MTRQNYRERSWYLSAKLNKAIEAGDFQGAGFYKDWKLNTGKDKVFLK